MVLAPGVLARAAEADDVLPEFRRRTLAGSRRRWHVNHAVLGGKQGLIEDTGGRGVLQGGGRLKRVKSRVLCKS